VLSANNFGNYFLPPGCSLTQGYWKTHSLYGPAAHPDETWLLVNGATTGGSFGVGPDSEFFDSGMTWLAVFNTAPQGGNAWLQLAHQYMAAVLNQLDGGGIPELQAKLDAAYVLLDKWDAQKNIPKSDPDRAAAIALAYWLDDYNNGEFSQHCGEPGYTGPTYK